MGAEHLVMVGKGGVGKSTTAANLAAALAEAGKRVLLIGYDARYDSTSPLLGEARLAPLPPWRGGINTALYGEGRFGTLCVEAGEAAAEGEGGEAAALTGHPVITAYAPEVVIHDVSAVPGLSFTLPPAVEGVARVYVVTSSDMAAIQVANELFHWLSTVSAVDCRFGGVIVNRLSGPLFHSIIADFVSEANTAIIGKISHSLMVSVSDFYSKTILEAAPDSPISYSYRKLARQVLEGKEVRRPAFLPQGTLKKWAMKWGDIIAELETGVVQGGEAI